VQRKVSGTHQNTRWPSEGPRTSVPSSAQQAEWRAQRAGWKLANRGDNRYSAERRLWRMQMRVLRREWEMQALVRRREQYVAQREQIRSRTAKEAEKAAAREEAARKKALESPSEHELERAAQMHRELQARRAKLREMRLRKMDEAETEVRREWMREKLKTHELGEHAGIRAVGKRVIVTPDVSHPLLPRSWLNLCRLRIR
ncbi:MAG: hypothetical protein SGPRY_013375, partial [Prymnesium sp.]